ncbi:hypothetical protein OS493_011439 [Desmophyllum pertusum]|uniref:CARD domain-containing protein n=1 Tax=Desmophyllum pertusum TaxID=174260 RepID=A0A9W9YQE4_9CNID|nr:hypothetical protein OS493_011439 [Desmophyllum pertusum]
MAVRPSPDTPLDDKYRKMIRSNMENIIKDLEPLLLLHYMTDVLDEYDIESIKKKETRKEEARTLLDILPRRGSKTFWNFIKTLQKKQSFLVSYFIDETVENGTKENAIEYRISWDAPLEVAPTHCSWCKVWEAELKSLRSEIKELKEQLKT